MNLQTIIDKLELKVLTKPLLFQTIEIDAAYMSDLLSCVMTSAKPHSVWVTLIANINIVAVSSLLEIRAVIITENAQPDQATIDRADKEGVVLLSTPKGNHEISGKLWEMGVRDS
jgi:hypothetical protein